MTYAHLGLVAVVAACSSSAPAPAVTTPAPAPAPARTDGVEVAVPSGPAPALDGRVDDAEWARARAIDLGRGVTLRLMHDRAKLYLAVSGLPSSELGFVCVLLAERDQVSVFHASAKLGSALYAPAPGAAHRPRSKTYEWRDAETLLRDEGWTGTTIHMTEPSQQELAVTFARLGLPGQPHPIAIGYFVNPRAARDLAAASTLVWPRGLADATGNVQLIAGLNPDDLRFDPRQWAVVRIAD